MFNPATLIRPHIRYLPAYEPILPFEVLSHQLGRSVTQIIKLDANENPYGISPATRRALAQVDFPHIYPDPESRALTGCIIRVHRHSRREPAGGFRGGRIDRPDYSSIP